MEGGGEMEVGPMERIDGKGIRWRLLIWPRDRGAVILSCVPSSMERTLSNCL